MPKYPEHEKLKEHGELPWDLYHFMDWMRSQGYIVAEWRTFGRYDEHEELLPSLSNTTSIVYQFLGLDESKLDREAQEIIKDFKERKVEHHD